VDRATRAVLDELVGREVPDREALRAHEYEWLDALNAAWVDGRIPGFPDETEFDAAFDWLLTVPHLEEAELREELAGTPGFEHLEYTPLTEAERALLARARQGRVGA
jgi:hypothetical protein